ncbi:MAG: 5'-nucleotidase C-terminal domain-containing protein [Bacteroidaceae bacterium]|nr:5'-nucleotidase C-terminal domain-containing protein [Bacteroidaceae bacterium]
MIRINLSLLLPALALCLGSCSSLQTQQTSSRAGYALRVVKPMRIEVTSTLDSNPVAEVFEFLAPYQSGVDSLQRPYVGRSAQFMTVQRPECLLSNWVADVMVAEGERLGYKPDMGLCNIGGLRSALPQDTVRRGDVLAVAPFENFFTIVEMRGIDMLRLMENIAAVHGEGVSHSVRMVISKDGQLRSATINGEPIEPARVYVVATIDYLSYGNDKMYALKDAQKSTITTKAMRDVLIDYLQWLDSQGQMAHSEIEGRIVEKD